MRGEKTERELHCLKVIGDNIKAARKHRGLSQRDLAKKLDVSQTMVSYWEAGKGAPDGYDILMLCKALEVSADLLLGVPRKWQKIHRIY